MTEPKKPSPRRKPRTAKTPSGTTEPPAAPLDRQDSVGDPLTTGELTAAMSLADELDRPVRIPPDHHLDTGLADYGMWLDMFAKVPPEPPGAKAYRAGRIWS
ncbi:hypothetical protein ACPZ19_50495 [Amycolatopsis lurida]